MKTTPDHVTTRRRIGSSTVARVIAGGLAAGSVVGLFATAGPASAAPDKVHKSYVCKYVVTPHAAQSLQTGQNPIWVDNHALFGSPADYDAAGGLTEVGQKFNDGQMVSVVLVPNTAKLDPEPSAEGCTSVNPPTSSTTTTKPPTTTTTTTTGTTPAETTTTAALIPATTTSSTTSSSSTTASSSTSSARSTTPVTPAATTTTPATAASLYPLQPVKAGVNSDGTTREVVVSPLRAALVLLVLFGLWVAFGGRLPHARRIGSPRDGS